MTDEQKDLLFKDLCARMPYNTKVQLTEYSDLTGEKLPSEIRILDYYMIGKVQAYCKGFRKDEVKPYLFPISSITKEQRDEFPFELSLLNAFINGHISLFEDEELSVDDIIRMMDCLNRNHIDYRGLIPMGLAVDATNLNVY